MEQQQEQLQKALALHQAGNIGEAARIYRDILLKDPNNVMVIHLLCVVAMNYDNAQMVLGLSEQGIRIEPKFAVLHQDRATALRRMGLKEQALDAIQRAIELEKNPDFFDTCASILRDMRRYDEAVAALDIAIKMDPKNPKFHNHMGIVLGRMGANEKAIPYFDTFISMKPHATEGYNNKANVLKALGKYSEAINSYAKALAIDPNIFMGKANKALAHLVLGDLEQGWDLFEDRKPGNMPPEGQRFDAAKRWRGQTDKAATIIVYNEQGLGDSIQFCRYLPQVMERVGPVILQVQASLVQLMKAHWPDITIITPEDALPDYTYQCPLLSLPGIFGTRLDTIPLAEGYMRAASAAKEHWKKELAFTDKKKVGLVWAGNPDHLNDHIRSIPLSMFHDILRLPGYTFFSLQKGSKALEQLKALPSDITLHEIGSVLHDFTDTAGLLSNLDVLITVDTSVLHLAGALGTPAWALLQFDPDWRWLLERSDTPWYRSVRLFRQKASGEWKSALDDVLSSLKA